MSLKELKAGIYKAMLGSHSVYKGGIYKTTLARELTKEERRFFERKKLGIENFMVGCSQEEAETAFEKFIINFKMTSEEVSFLAAEFKHYPYKILQEAAYKILYGEGIKIYGKPNIELVNTVLKIVLEPIDTCVYNLNLILNADFEKTFVKKDLSPEARAKIDVFIGK
ncbi:MAG: hypothetical protein RLZZ292_1943 [Bacteroidota bacterium]|jgi:hypothetical protein